MKLLWILLLAAAPVKAESAKTAVELIDQAHEHDNMYNSDPEVSQQKALSLYSKALEAKPDDGQRLHILFRMAQLYACAFQVEKGEKPDFSKAINLYKEIVESYPPHEPEVIHAKGLISDHYTTLGEFEKAVAWAKKIIEHDTSEPEEQIKAIEERLESLATPGIVGLLRLNQVNMVK